MIEVLNTLQPLLMVLLGGVLAMLGSVFTIRQQAQSARRVRMDERFAEKKVEVNAQAYKKAKTIEAMLLQCDTEQTLKQIDSDQEWFFDQRLFLPGQFPQKWLAVRGCLIQASVLERDLRDSDRPRVLALHQKAETLITDALREVYSDAGVKPMEIELLDTTMSELPG